MTELEDWQPIEAPAGMFFCEGCLENRPLGEQSPDPRYCQPCFEFLLEEAELSGWGRAEWIPRPASKPTPQELIKPLEGVLGVTKPPTKNHQGKGLGGRPRVKVSIEQVAHLTARGYSLRDIGKELGVSHMTISRVLSRGRK